MENLKENAMDRELLEIINNLGLPDTSIKKSPKCPDESVLFDFLDDDILVSKDTVKHLESCFYCVSELKRVADSILSCPALTDEELKLANSKQPTVPLTSSKLVIKAIKDNLISIFNPTLIPTEGYRATSTTGLIIFNEEQKKFAFNLEVHPAKDKEGFVTILIELTKTKLGNLDFELWKNETLMRSYSLKQSQKQSFSSWQIKDNYLIRVLDKEGDQIYDMKLVLL